jgi:hypothetical protein
MEKGNADGRGQRAKSKWKRTEDKGQRARRRAGERGGYKDEGKIEMCTKGRTKKGKRQGEGRSPTKMSRKKIANLHRKHNRI